MEKKPTPVLVTLSSMAKPEHGEAEAPIRMMCHGHIRQVPSGFMLRYQEVQQDDETKQTLVQDVMLTLQPDRVTMNRLGDYGTTMVFVRGTRFEGAYHTPFGDLGMALYTTKVDCSLSLERGSIHLEYQLDMQGSYAAVQMIDIAYQAENAPVC